MDVWRLSVGLCRTLIALPAPVKSRELKITDWNDDFIILEPFSSFISIVSDCGPISKCLRYDPSATSSQGPITHPATGGKLSKHCFTASTSCCLWYRWCTAISSRPSLNHLQLRGDVTLPSCRGIADLCTATCCWGPERLLSPPLQSVWEETETVFFPHLEKKC